MANSCHPFGGWEIDPQFPTYPQWTKDYEEQVTKAPGLDYVVRIPGDDGVKFDGYPHIREAVGDRPINVFVDAPRFSYGPRR